MLWLVIQMFLLSVLSRPAAALDCDLAKSPIEQAICTTSELSDADAAMTKAYVSLRSALPVDQQAALLADQRSWLRNRDAICGEKKDRELVECVLAQTEQRRRFLSGEGVTRAPDAPRLQPAFFDQTKKGRYELDVRYPRIIKPSGPAQSAFNKAARELALDRRALDEIRDWQAAPGAPGISSYTVNYDVTYLDPRLAAIVFTIDTYGAGAAHPNSSRESLVFDLSGGRKLSLGDVLGTPAEAVPAISELCKSQLKAQADKEDWQLFDDADFPAVVRELVHWAPDKDGVNILFDQYSIAAYAFGRHECRLAWSNLQPWLKPGGPLPPR